VIVVVTAAAKTDLLAIRDYITQASPDRAETFIEELLDCCDALADQHGLFPLVPRYESLAIRRRIYGRYLIFYRVQNSNIEIIHILHGARDIDTLLFGEFGEA
jgi:toxin ParE1/3/4